MEVHDMVFSLKSSVFQHSGEIPSRHTCDGEDLSPPLSWTGVPAGTKSLAMIVDDPDAPDPKAPKMTWVHWMLYNIPPGTTGFTEGMTGKKLPQGTLEGINDWKQTGYRGPCPPIGRHRYYHKLYALDTALSDLKQPAKAILEKSMKGHILAQTELMGTYIRAR
jgi:hypothetical protein